MGDCHKIRQKFLMAGLNWMFQKSLSILIIFAARRTKTPRRCDGLSGQLLSLFHNCLKAVNQMGSVICKIDFWELMTKKVCSDTWKALRRQMFIAYFLKGPDVY